VPNLVDGGARLVLALKQHAEEALTRVPRYLSEKPRFMALLESFVASAQALEVALQAVLNESSIETAVGAQLDQLGAVVGQPRKGLDDATYRVLIKAKILVNKSSGTIPDLIAIFVACAASSPVVKDGGNATVVVSLLQHAEDADLIPFFLAFLRDAKSAGVRAILEWIEVEPEEAFRYDTGPGYDDGHYAGADDV
jgi:hypothetical protein